MTYVPFKNQNIERKFYAQPLTKNSRERARLLEKKRKSVDRFMPNPRDFADDVPGGKEEIEIDLRRLEATEKIFETESQIMNKEDSRRLEVLKEISEIFEGALIDQIEGSGWLGVDCEVTATSRYDDVVNGIDAVGIVTPEDRESSYIGFAIDVTFSSHEKGVEKKFKRILKNINDGTLPEVKYFRNDKGEYAPLLVPKIIIGADLFSAQELIKVWGSEVLSTKARAELLQNHPMQVRVITQLFQQIEFFYKYSQEVGQEDIARAYEKLYDVFAQVYDDNEDFIKQHVDELERCEVYKAIERMTQRMEG